MIGNTWFRRAAAWVAAGGLCVTLAAGAVQAAPEGKEARPGKAARQARRGGWMALVEKLNLTDAQKAKLHDLRARRRAEVQKLKSDGDRQARRSRLKEMNTKFRAEVMAILTPAQRDQLKAEMQKARADRKAAQQKS